MRKRPQRIGTSLAVLLLAASLPTLADSRIEKEFDVAPGGSFLLKTDAGSVVLAGTSESKIRVVITSKTDDIQSQFDFHFDETPGRVEVRAERKGPKVLSWFRWGSGVNLHYEVHVPSQTNVEIDTAGGSIEAQGVRAKARLETSGGSIHASKIGGELQAETSGGSIKIEDTEAAVSVGTSGGGITVDGVRGDLRAETSGGSITIRAVTGNVEADTSGGSIRIGEVGGRVHAETSGGSVSCAFTAGNASGGELSTSGGGIEAKLDPSIGLEIDAETSGGTVVADVPITVQGKVGRSSLRGKVGSGGPLLRLRASGGPIRIEPL